MMYRGKDQAELSGLGLQCNTDAVRFRRCSVDTCGTSQYVETLRTRLRLMAGFSFLLDRKPERIVIE